jgi:hypothetical protein
VWRSRKRGLILTGGMVIVKQSRGPEDWACSLLSLDPRFTRIWRILLYPFIRSVSVDPAYENSLVIIFLGVTQFAGKMVVFGRA